MRIEDYSPVQHFAEPHVLVVDAPGGEPVPAGGEWMAARQTLAKKLAHHLHTIAEIHQGFVLSALGASCSSITCCSRCGAPRWATSW